MKRCNIFKCAMAFLCSLFIAFFISLCLASCEYNQVITPDSEVVQIKLDYSLPFTAGTRSVEAEDVYDEYYEQQILTRKLTPKNFELTLNGSDKYQYSITGIWGKDNSLCPKVGNYKVYGSSKPADNPLVSDTVSFTFNTEIKISKNQTDVIIPATYSNSLLLFKAENIKSVKARIDKREVVDKEFEPHNGIYGLYVNCSYDSDYYSYQIIITFENGKQYVIYYKSCGFEVGKYYYFNLATMGFDLPKMENGNG